MARCRIFLVPSVLLFLAGMAHAQNAAAPAQDLPRAEVGQKVAQPAVQVQPAPKVEEPKKEIAKKETAPPGDDGADDRKILQGAGVPADGKSLLEYFRQRTFPEADPKLMAGLVRQLGDEDFEVREKAYARLSVMGAGALVGLKSAERDADVEVQRRAEELRQRIETKAEPQVQAAVARLIARVKPAGAANVLLDYLPFAPDNEVVDELCRTLAAVAKQGGKADPIIVQALGDKIAVKRGAAGSALVRAGLVSERQAVLPLLKDPDPTVRLRVGLALAWSKEKEALPVLVDLLAILEPEHLWPVEELLVRLAGDKTPSVSLGNDEPSRKACRTAWSTWYENNKGTIDLAKLEGEPALLGYTLVVQQNFNRIVNGRRVTQQGLVLELDHNKKVRWKFEMPTYPVDAQVVQHDRVLVAEYQAGRVTERDFKGQIVWERAVGGNPIGVQRLPGGTTFVVTQQRLVEFDKSGKEVLVINRPNSDIFRARKLRNGEVAFVTNSGQYVRMEAKTQKVLKSFQVGQIPVLFGSIDVLPNGHVVVPDFQRQRVVEYDAQGREKTAFNSPWPNAVQRLPNGNTLVSSQNSRRVAEYDRNGREVWTYQDNQGMPFNARRR